MRPLYLFSCNEFFVSRRRPRSEEHTPIVFSCVLALSVSIAVGCLLGTNFFLKNVNYFSKKNIKKMFFMCAGALRLHDCRLLRYKTI